MLESKTNTEVKRKIRINPRGRLIKVTNEIYTRDDIPCGFGHCDNCISPKQIFDSTSNSLFFIGYDIIRNYFDCIFNAQISNIIISQSTIEQIKETSEQTFKRLKNIINLEKWRNIYIFPNEFFSPTAIKKQKNVSNIDQYRALEISLFQYFSKHLFDQNLNMIYITNDQQLIVDCREFQLTALPLFSFVKKICPHQQELKDFIGFDEARYSQFVSENKELIFHHKPHIESNSLMNLVLSGKLLRGKIKFNRNISDEAKIFSFALNREIIIKGLENTNRALEGDVVAIELLDENLWLYTQQRINLTEEVNETADMKDDQTPICNDEKTKLLKQKLQNLDIAPTGKVVGIIKRDLRNFAGQIIQEYKGSDLENTLGVVGLSDSRLANVLILSSNLKMLVNKKIIVAIDSWPEFSRYPIGRCIKILGDAGKTEIENDAILFEFNIETLDFSQKVLECLPKEEDYIKIAAEEVKKRLDLRNYNVCSVDPPGCKDIDDALHCRQIDNDTWEAGVHIADVSFFVRPFTALDNEAANRCTTVYLVDRRTDMLPKLLTEKLCSLVGGEERLAFSVFWEFNPKSGLIKKCWFSKTIIKSKKAYSYQQAQERIDDKSDNTELTQSLRRLMHISKNLKQKRLENGALQLASTQVKFKMDEDSNPTDVSYYDLKETNSMVEEFMLLANVAVAEKITESYPALSILRRHTTPKPEMIKQLAKIFTEFGFNLDYSSSKSLAESLNCINRTNDPFFNTLARIMTTRCMNEAIYFCSSDFDPSEYRHYGLAVDFYTHFTSPIRRYADILVHRLLAASIDIESLPENMLNKTNLISLCERMNMRNRNARNASRASSEFFSHLFFKDKTFEEEAIISSLQNNGFFVTIVRYGFDAFVDYTEEDTNINNALEAKGINPLVKCYYKTKLMSLFDWVKVKLSIKLVNYRKVVTVQII